MLQGSINGADTVVRGQSGPPICTVLNSSGSGRLPAIVTAGRIRHIVANLRRRHQQLEQDMDELNGRMIACQILITGLIARVANDSPDPLRFLSDYRDEIKAVVRGINIAGMENTDRVWQTALQTVDEMFSLMKPPSAD
jgi:hypothetical protein